MGKIKNGRKKRLFFTGLSMGVADLVPGVSGGTVAFLYGIYDELLYSIKLVTGGVPALIFKGKLAQAVKAVPFAFLLPVFLGILTGIFGFVRLVNYGLANHPVYIWSLFFGLVLGSVYVVSKRIKVWNFNRLALLFLGALITYLVVGLSSISANPTGAVLFGAGAIASVAMILPGISGSLILVILGQYKNVVGFVEANDFMRLGIFALGALLGLALFARVLGWLLRVHHSGVIAFLIGMMLGSLRRVWPWQSETAEGLYVAVRPDLGYALLGSIFLTVAGFLLVRYLEKLGVAKEHDDIKTKDFITEVKHQHD